MKAYRLKDDVQWRQVEGEVVAVDLGLGRYVGINSSGAQLWPMLQNGSTAEALLQRLVDIYGLPRDVARTDLDAWLRWLEQHELLSP